MPGKQWYTKRRESKYYVSMYQYLILKSLLSSVMELDSNAGVDGDYFVRSLYLDSIRGMDIKEKEIGVTHRRKIRIRCYQADSTTYKFEVKEKMNKHTIKKSLLLDKKQSLEISDGFFESIFRSAPKLYDHLLSHVYKPSVIIDYEREAYVSELFNVRINFDKNIRGSRDVASFYEEDISMIPLIDPELYILEVKHDGHLPDHIQKILASIDLTGVSYSKYYYGGLL